MPETADVKVISLGGSIIAPDHVDVDFLDRFVRAVGSHLEQEDRRLGYKWKLIPATIHCG